MGSTQTTAVKFHEPEYCQIDIRVYRKSDKHYWTCQIRFDCSVMSAIGILHAWTSGLSIHPNLESVMIDAIRTLPTTGASFADYTDLLRTYLDEGKMDEYVA